MTDYCPTGTDLSNRTCHAQPSLRRSIPKENTHAKNGICTYIHRRSRIPFKIYLLHWFGFRLAAFGSKYASCKPHSAKIEGFSFRVEIMLCHNMYVGISSIKPVPRRRIFGSTKGSKPQSSGNAPSPPFSLCFFFFFSGIIKPAKRRAHGHLPCLPFSLLSLPNDRNNDGPDRFCRRFSRIH